MVEEHAATETPSAEVEPDVEAGEEPVEETPEGEPTPAPVPTPTHYTRDEVNELVKAEGLRLEAQYNTRFETSRRDMQSFAQNYANTAVKEAQKNFGGQISTVKRDAEISEALRDDPETKAKVLGIVSAYSPKPSEETPTPEPQPRTEQAPAETGALTVGHILAQTAKNQGIDAQDPRLDWALDEGDVTKTTQRFQASIERIKAAGGKTPKGGVPATEPLSHIPEGKPDSSTPPTPESSGLKSGVKTAAQAARDFGDGLITVEEYLSYPENREKQNLPRLE